MVDKPVTYVSLQKLLHQLGFTETVVPGSYVVYNHPEPNTLLMYRDYRATDLVSWADLTSTRRFLDLRGLLAEDAFDRLLQEAAA
jgi:hypothetical protein